MDHAFILDRDSFVALKAVRYEKRQGVSSSLYDSGGKSMKRYLMTGAATFLLAGFLLSPAVAVKAAAVPTAASSGETASSSSSQTGRFGSTKHCKCFVGGDRMALVLLANLSKKSVAELKEQYPQQTPWQIAKQMNQLDALKKVYLEKQQQHIRLMQEQGNLAQADGTRLFELLAGRVAKIDGVKIVTVGYVRL